MPSPDPIKAPSQPTRRTNPDYWLSAIFSSPAARNGGTVRRPVDWVEREIGRDILIAEVRQRGFHLLECRGQFVIICIQGACRVIC